MLMKTPFNSAANYRINYTYSILTKYFICSFALLFFSCDSTKKDNASAINIEHSLSDFRISPLSSYASKIRYVQLETRNNCLIAQDIKKIYLEKGKLFVHDNEPFLKVFDANTGKYLYNIGRKGQGPGELPFLGYIDINPGNKQILLSWSKYTHKFDFNGQFIANMERPESDTIELHSNVAMLDDSLYAAGCKSNSDHQEYAAIVFDTNKKRISFLLSYRDMIQHPIYKTWSPLRQGGFFYRTGKDVRYYRGISDTIYTYNREQQQFKPVFSFDFGKHLSHFNFNPGEENPELIQILQGAISENPTHIYLDFQTLKSSPEPFKETIYKFDQWREVVNNNIYGIYDKQKQELHFLLQPIPEVRGLKNDLDGGIPFWPKSISSDFKMLDYHHASRFLELAEKVKNPDESFSAFVRTCSEEDNPIVIIVE